MDEDECFNYLLSEGVIEESGKDDDGETLYTYNFEAMKRLIPGMYEEVMSEINSGLSNLFMRGLINVEYDEELKATISATEEGKRAFERYHDM